MVGTVRLVVMAAVVLTVRELSVANPVVESVAAAIEVVTVMALTVKAPETVREAQLTAADAVRVVVEIAPVFVMPALVVNKPDTKHVVPIVADAFTKSVEPATNPKTDEMVFPLIVLFGQLMLPKLEVSPLQLIAPLVLMLAAVTNVVTVSELKTASPPLTGATSGTAG